MHSLPHLPARSALALALLGLALFAKADAQGLMPPFSVAPDPNPAAPLALDWETLKTTPRMIGIVNNTAQQLRLKVELGSFNGPDGAERPIDLAPYLTVEEPDVTLPPAKTVYVKVRIKDPPLAPLPAPGAYTGSLIILDTSPRATPAAVPSSPYRRQLVIGFPELRQPAVPAVTKLTVRVVRYCPIDLFCDSSFGVPLKQAVSLAPTDVPPTFYLSREPGGVAVVRQLPPDAGGGPQNTVRFDVESVPYAGKYDGTLSLGPRPPGAVAAGDIALTVYATDFFLWPLLVLLLSIFLTQWTRYYIDVKRQIWAWRRQEAELGVAYHQSKRQFSRTAADHHLHTTYSIESDLTARREAVLARIEGVERASWLSVQEPGAESKERPLGEELAWLLARVSAWGRVPVHILKLRDALALAYPATMATAAAGAQSPVMVKECSDLIVGGPLAVDKFEERGAFLTAKAAVVEVWGGLCRRAEACRRRAAELEARDAALPAAEKLSAANRRRLEGAALAAKEALEALWKVSAGEGDKLGEIAGTLDSAEETLRQLDGLLGAAPVAVAVAEAVVMGELLATQPVAAHQPSSLIEGIKRLEISRAEWRLRRKSNDEERARRYQKEIRKWDWLTTGLAATAAIVTALYTYYLGSAFGTLKDYAALFVWSVGAQATLTVLTAALGRLLPSLLNSGFMPQPVRSVPALAPKGGGGGSV